MTEKKSFFSTGQIAVLAVTAIAMVILIGMLAMAQTAKSAMPTEINVPSGNLSDSVFEAQNRVYEADADFPVQYALTHLNAIVDVPDVQNAAIGNGKVWKLNDGFYIYITEGKSSDFPASFYSELAQVFVAGADETNVTGEILKTEQGYLNGIALSYVVIQMDIVKDGATSTAYVAGYLYADSESGYSAFVSCTVLNSSNLASAQIVAEKEITLLQNTEE